MSIPCVCLYLPEHHSVLTTTAFMVRKRFNVMEHRQTSAWKLVSTVYFLRQYNSSTWKWCSLDRWGKKCSSSSKNVDPFLQHERKILCTKNTFKSWHMRCRCVSVWCSHVSMIEVPILPAILKIDDKKSQCNCNKDSQQAQTDLVLTHRLFYFLCD